MYFKDSWSFKKKRKKVKKILLRMLFADPDDDRHQRTVYNDGNAPIWQCFSLLYPEIAELFSIIKMYDYKNLCMLLQRIEATAMLSKVCLALQKQLPQAPIFTIHDCLVTTVDQVDTVKKIMQKAISDFIGFKASVSEEKWSDFCLKLPKRLQPKIAA